MVDAVGIGARRSLLAALLLAAFASTLLAQNARDIVAKSVELDQSNWQRMKDYTWIARQTDRVLDSSGQMKSQKIEEWETVVIYGEPHRRMLQRNGQKLSDEDQRKEQQKLDEAVAKRERETPQQRARREADFEHER